MSYYWVKASQNLSIKLYLAPLRTSSRFILATESITIHAYRTGSLYCSLFTSYTIAGHKGNRPTDQQSNSMSCPLYMRSFLVPILPSTTRSYCPTNSCSQQFFSFFLTIVDPPLVGSLCHTRLIDVHRVWLLLKFFSSPADKQLLTGNGQQLRNKF